MFFDKTQLNSLFYKKSIVHIWKLTISLQIIFLSLVLWQPILLVYHYTSCVLLNRWMKNFFLISPYSGENKIHNFYEIKIKQDIISQIKIEKKKDSDPESDIEVDVDSDSEKTSNKTTPQKEVSSQTASEDAPVAVPLSKFEPLPKRQKKINLVRFIAQNFKISSGWDGLVERLVWCNKNMHEISLEN